MSHKIVYTSIINGLSNELQNQNGLIQVILGPRQVGKTTSILYFLEHLYKGKSHYLSADKVFNTSPSWIKEHWLIARQSESLLVIDEIQKVENWAEVIKSLWDEDKRLKKQTRCILLGSSSLDIQKGLTESLTGRFKLIRAYHWNSQESKDGYGLSLDEYMQYGGYPGSYPMITQANEWASYVKHSIIETVIEKDILQNQTVKSPSLFKQAFELLVSYPAKEISYTKLLGQLQDKGNTELIKNYIRLYEGAFLIKALDKYSTNRLKVKSSSPKILPLAPSLYYLGVLDSYTDKERGHVFELMVGAQLVRANLELYYWRELNHEVDYVVKYGRKLWAIEVKSGRKKSLTGLSKFKEKFPSSIAILITLENYLEFEEDPFKFLMKVG